MNRRQKLAAYLRAFFRSFTRYESDMGGWWERLNWEWGYAEAMMGKPCRKTELYCAYECGYATGECNIQKGESDD